MPDYREALARVAEHDTRIEELKALREGLIGDAGSLKKMHADLAQANQALQTLKSVPLTSTDAQQVREVEVRISRLESSILVAEETLDELNQEVAEREAEIVKLAQVLDAKNRKPDAFLPEQLIAHAESAYEQARETYEQALQAVKDLHHAHELEILSKTVLPGVQSLKIELDLGELPEVKTDFVQGVEATFGTFLPASADPAGRTKAVLQQLEGYRAAYQAYHAAAPGTADSVRALLRLNKQSEVLEALLGTFVHPEFVELRQKELQAALQAEESRVVQTVITAEHGLAKQLQASSVRDWLAERRVPAVEAPPVPPSVPAAPPSAPTAASERQLLETQLQSPDGMRTYAQEVLKKMGVPFTPAELASMLQARKKDAEDHKGSLLTVKANKVEVRPVDEVNLVQTMALDVGYLIAPDQTDKRLKATIEARLARLGWKLEPIVSQLFASAVDPSLTVAEGRAALALKLQQYIGRFHNRRGIAVTADGMDQMVKQYFEEWFKHLQGTLDGSFQAQQAALANPNVEKVVDASVLRARILDLEHPVTASAPTSPAVPTMPSMPASVDLTHPLIEGLKTPDGARAYVLKLFSQIGIPMTLEDVEKKLREQREKDAKTHPESFFEIEKNKVKRVKLTESSFMQGWENDIQVLFGTDSLPQAARDICQKRLSRLGISLDQRLLPILAKLAKPNEKTEVGLKTLAEALEYYINDLRKKEITQKLVEQDRLDELTPLFEGLLDEAHKLFSGELQKEQEAVGLALDQRAESAETYLTLIAEVEAVGGKASTPPPVDPYQLALAERAKKVTTERAQLDQFVASVERAEVFERALTQLKTREQGQMQAVSAASKLVLEIKRLEEELKRVPEREAEIAALLKSRGTADDKDDPKKEPATDRLKLVRQLKAERAPTLSEVTILEANLAALKEKLQQSEVPLKVAVANADVYKPFVEAFSSLDTALERAPMLLKDPSFMKILTAMTPVIRDGHRRQLPGTFLEELAHVAQAKILLGKPGVPASLEQLPFAELRNVTSISRPMRNAVDAERERRRRVEDLAEWFAKNSDIPWDFGGRQEKWRAMVIPEAEKLAEAIRVRAEELDVQLLQLVDESLPEYQRIAAHHQALELSEKNLQDDVFKLDKTPAKQLLLSCYVGLVRLVESLEMQSDPAVMSASRVNQKTFQELQEYVDATRPRSAKSATPIDVQAEIDHANQGAESFAQGVEELYLRAQKLYGERVLKMQAAQSAPETIKSEINTKERVLAQKKQELATSEKAEKEALAAYDDETETLVEQKDPEGFITSKEQRQAELKALEEQRANVQSKVLNAEGVLIEGLVQYLDKVVPLVRASAVAKDGSQAETHARIALQANAEQLVKTVEETGKEFGLVAPLNATSLKQWWGDDSAKGGLSTPFRQRFLNKLVEDLYPQPVVTPTPAPTRVTPTGGRRPRA